MNREISFRGVSVKNFQWVYGFYCYDSSTDKAYIIKMEDGIIQYFEVMPDSVGQCTGIEANNTTIFEGHVLDNVSDAQIKVCWNEKFGCWEAVDNEDGTNYGLLSNCEPENYNVIGNTYQ